MTEVTFLPIFLAGIVAVIIGFIWYHPQVFGGAWMRMSGITPETVERNQKGMWIRALVALFAAMVAAYVMSYFGIAWGVYDWIGSVELGFWCWIGFTAPAMLGSVLWERKPVSLYLINSLFWLVAFVAMALVLLFA